MYAIKLPESHEAADRLSQKAQKYYINLNKIYLALLFIVTILSVLVSNYRYIYVFIAIGMVASLLTTLLIRILKKEQIWYEGRAVAESIKTLSWRYMMKADPFNDEIEVASADKSFIHQVSNLLDQRKKLSSMIGATMGSAMITPEMKSVRGLPLQERRILYLEERVSNQREWYSKKSISNRESESNWFLAMFILQGLALIYAIIIASTTLIEVNLIPVFTILATISITWLQVRNHQELAQAYGIAAKELSIIESLVIDVEDEEKFSVYVNDTENAISREHTLWSARRNQ